jgi:outer membrane lipoprotein-sorting protein
LLSAFFATLIFSSISFAQIPDGIVNSIQTGNDANLAGFFNENVELVVLTHDDVYSKSQAQQIVAAFFKSNKPKQFEIIHQGGKEGARYAIGSLTTNTGIFRVYFLLKNKNNTSYIHQLKIEKQG